MKNYFYSILAVAAIFFASSCTQDEEFAGDGLSKPENVSFKVCIPESSSTRAIADGISVGEGKMVNTLLYALYENGKTEPAIIDFDRDAQNGVFEITMPLAKSIKYDILFFAYNSENCAFVIDDAVAANNNLKELVLKDDLYANQESYDAFAASLKQHKVDEDALTEVLLSRPFAQVNAATTMTDLNNAKKLSAEASKSNMKIYKAPYKYNVLTGEATGEKDITFKTADILKKYGATEYPFNEDLVADGKTYKYLALAYVLADVNKDIFNADMQFIREGDGQVVSELNINNLPLQRNSRTNVFGDLLTKTEGYTLSIDKSFGNPDNDFPL